MNRYSLFLLLMPFLFLSACKGQDDPLDQASGFGEITATIDGVAFSAEVNYVSMIEGNLNLGLIGSNDAQMQIENATTGPLDFDDSQASYVITAIFDLDDGRRIVATDGTLTLERLDSKTKGSFSFTGFDMNGSGTASVSISNGTFSGTLAQ